MLERKRGRREREREGERLVSFGNRSEGAFFYFGERATLFSLLSDLALSRRCAWWAGKGACSDREWKLLIVRKEKAPS